jgi:hypothetical protein
MAEAHSAEAACASWEAGAQILPVSAARCRGATWWW